MDKKYKLSNKKLSFHIYHSINLRQKTSYQTVVIDVTKNNYYFTVWITRNDFGITVFYDDSMKSHVFLDPEH